MAAIGRIILSGLVFSALSCGPSLNLEGTWIGFRNIQARPDEDPAVIRSLSIVEVQIDDRGTFVLFERGLPKTGRVSYSGGKAHLNVDEVLQSPVSKGDQAQFEGITLTPSGEGKVEFRQPFVASEPVMLEKQPDAR